MNNNLKKVVIFLCRLFQSSWKRRQEESPLKRSNVWEWKKKNTHTHGHTQGYIHTVTQLHGHMTCCCRYIQAARWSGSYCIISLAARWDRRQRETSTGAPPPPLIAFTCLHPPNSLHYGKRVKITSDPTPDDLQSDKGTLHRTNLTGRTGSSRQKSDSWS